MKDINEVRTRIIEAAEKHFSHLGFEKTTLDDITGEDGKCKTSIYYHFKNKHDIFKSVIEKEFNEVMKDLQKVIDAEGSDRLRCMKDYMRTRLESLQRQGAYSRFASSRFVYGDNPVSRAINEARSRFDSWERQFFEISIEAGQAEGMVPASVSPQVFSSTVVNMLKAMEIQFFTSEDKANVNNTYMGMIDLIIR